MGAEYGVQLGFGSSLGRGLRGGFVSPRFVDGGWVELAYQLGWREGLDCGWCVNFIVGGGGITTGIMEDNLA